MPERVELRAMVRARGPEAAVARAIGISRSAFHMFLDGESGLETAKTLKLMELLEVQSVSEARRLMLM